MLNVGMFSVVAPPIVLHSKGAWKYTSKK
jgi:hypothetical protein